MKDAMDISEDGVKLIQDFEACARIGIDGQIHPYPDENQPPVWTIGWGSIRWEDGTPVKETDVPITQKRADDLFAYNLKAFVDAVNKLIDADLDQNQFDALVSFCYNIGPGFPTAMTPDGSGFYISTVRKRVNADPSDPTIRDALMMWDKVAAGGHLVDSPGLVYRRGKEADRYFGAA